MPKEIEVTKFLRACEHWRDRKEQDLRDKFGHLETPPPKPPGRGKYKRGIHLTPEIFRVIRKGVKEGGWSQMRLADASGVSLNYVKYAMGSVRLQKRIPRQALETLADFLGVDLPELEESL